MNTEVIFVRKQVMSDCPYGLGLSVLYDTPYLWTHPTPVKSRSKIKMYYLIACFAALAVANSGNITVCVMIFYLEIVAVTIKPKSLNVSLNLIATFTCISPGSSHLFFSINGKSTSDPSNAGRGLNEGAQSVIINGTRYRNLTVETEVINNNTNISCTSVIGSDVMESEPALLRIQGNKQHMCPFDYIHRSIS